MKCLSGKLHKLQLLRILLYLSCFTHAQIYNEADVSSFSPLSFAMTKGYSPPGIRRARNISSWSFHDGTVWLFLKSLILMFSVSLLHLRGNNLWFVFSFMVRRLIEIRESLGQSEKSASFFSLFYQASFKKRQKLKKNCYALCFGMSFL